MVSMKGWASVLILRFASRCLGFLVHPIESIINQLSWTITVFTNKESLPYQDWNHGEMGNVERCSKFQAVFVFYRQTSLRNSTWPALLYETNNFYKEIGYVQYILKKFPWFNSDKDQIQLLQKSNLLTWLSKWFERFLEGPDKTVTSPATFWKGKWSCFNSIHGKYTSWMT